MQTPQLLIGTMIGAVAGGVIINPCNGGAAVGAGIGLIAGVVADLSMYLASQSVREAPEPTAADHRYRIHPAYWIAAALLFVFAVVWPLMP